MVELSPPAEQKHAEQGAGARAEFRKSNQSRPEFVSVKNLEGPPAEASQRFENQSFGFGRENRQEQGELLSARSQIARREQGPPRMRKSRTENFNGENIFEDSNAPGSDFQSCVQRTSAREELTPNFKPRERKSSESMEDSDNFSDKTKNFINQMKQVHTVNFDVGVEAKGEELELMESEVQKINFKKVSKENTMNMDFLLSSVQQSLKSLPKF